MGNTVRDLLLVCPDLSTGSLSGVYMTTAQELGIPVAACIASWDNLTSKQILGTVPDAVFVWNEIQRGEARDIHGIPEERVVVTGAQCFDQWFEWAPRPREEFCRRVGIDPERPYLLYVAGSLAHTAPPEVDLANEWLRRLRSSRHESLREVGVLVRPHPKRSEQWLALDPPDDRVVVWPTPPVHMPVDHGDRADYFDSMYHSATVVGLNSTAMIEAAIVGRSVHTLLFPEYEDTQGCDLPLRVPVHGRRRDPAAGAELRGARGPAGGGARRHRRAGGRAVEALRARVRPAVRARRPRDAALRRGGRAARGPQARRPAAKAALALSAARGRYRRRVRGPAARARARLPGAGGAPPADVAVRVLFSAETPLSLTAFQSVLGELAARGHEVTVAIHEEREIGWRDRLLDEVTGGAVAAEQAVSPRADRWLELSADIRSSLDLMQFLGPRFNETYRARAWRRAPKPAVALARSRVGSRPGVRRGGDLGARRGRARGADEPGDRDVPARAQARTSCSSPPTSACGRSSRTFCGRPRRSGCGRRSA